MISHVLIILSGDAVYDDPAGDDDVTGGNNGDLTFRYIEDAPAGKETHSARDRIFAFAYSGVILPLYFTSSKSWRIWRSASSNAIRAEVRPRHTWPNWVVRAECIRSSWVMPYAK